MDPSQVAIQVLLLGVLPGAVGAIALTAAWWKRRDDAKPGPAWLLPLLLALAVIWAECVVQQRLPMLWPRVGQATDRVPHAAALLGIAGVALALVRAPLLVRLMTMLVVTPCAFWLIFGALHQAGSWTTAQLATRLGAMTLIALALSALLDRGAVRERALETTAALFLTAHAAAVVILQAAVAHHAQLAGGVTAILGSCLVVAALRRTFTPLGGVTTAIALLTLLVSIGLIFGPSGIAPAQLILLGITPVTACLAWLPPVARLNRWIRAAIVAAAGTLTSGTAIGLALAAAAANQYPY